MRTLLAAVLALTLVGCDETTALDADPSVLVLDAVAAREAGDHPLAVELLERAYERAPDDPVVRVELATTLLQRDGLDLLGLERIGRFLADGAGASSDGARVANRCAQASAPDAQTFRLADVEGFGELVAHAETVSRAADLLAAVVPATLQRFDVCTSVADGALVYDRDGALAELAGLGRERAAQALAVHALAQFFDAYLAVSARLDQEVTWVRLADDPGALRAGAQVAVGHLGQAALALDARAGLVGSGSLTADVVAVALDAYETVRDALGVRCDS